MLHLLLSPLSWGVLTLCGLHLARGKGLRRALWFALLLCAVLAAPVGANALVWVIENRLPAGPVCGPEDHAPVLILTGGFDDTPRDTADFAALTSVTLRRLSAGLEVAARDPKVAVIISGGAEVGAAEADVAGALAVRLGLAPGRLTVERTARNTWQNASASARLLPGPQRRVQLVTSALHAPRAVVALQAQGITSCRHVADSIYTPVSGVGHFIPQSSSLAKTERALHELVGLASYRLQAAVTR